MSTLPQLLEGDIRRFDEVLEDLLHKTDASVAAVIDHGGFLITSQGQTRNYDLTTIAALASGTYLANQTIAGLVNEAGFNCVYQQGETNSLFVCEVDQYCLLAVIFKANVGVGVVRYYAATAAQQLSLQLRAAHERAPDAGFDLSALNVADTQDLFGKKE
jgi:predicted regulator of Ras-like GTPase activity (Roadblock/LC7/MglB family)